MFPGTTYLPGLHHHCLQTRGVMLGGLPAKPHPCAVRASPGNGGTFPFLFPFTLPPSSCFPCPLGSHCSALLVSTAKSYCFRGGIQRLQLHFSAPLVHVHHFWMAATFSFCCGLPSHGQVVNTKRHVLLTATSGCTILIQKTCRQLSCINHVPLCKLWSKS